MPIKTMPQAIQECQDQILASDRSAIVIGEGVPDPKGIFGTTLGLKQKYPDRVFDTPISENAMTGVCIGLSLAGFKPIHIHQRIDFTLYAADQIINNASKWYSMFGGKAGRVSMVIRAIIGRGWGQGNQHSQNLSFIYAGIPGLKVLCPSTAYTAKGLLYEAYKDPGPVMFIEHRWCHNLTSEVPDQLYSIPMESRIVRKGKDITIVAWGYMVIECLRAAEFLSKQGIECELIDLQCLNPIDTGIIVNSINKTGKILCVEDGWKESIISPRILVEIQNLTYPLLLGVKFNMDGYAPASQGLIKDYYPSVKEIINAICKMCDKIDFNFNEVNQYDNNLIHDIPDQSFKGPF